MSGSSHSWLSIERQAIIRMKHKFAQGNESLGLSNLIFCKLSSEVSFDLKVVCKIIDIKEFNILNIQIIESHLCL